MDTSSTSEVLLYIVQRCWYSGPQQYQPMDYLRLFHTQREAEEAAYHNAHAWNKMKQNGRKDGAVKTLLLPSYAPSGTSTSSSSSSSYGFISHGTLFWVRACVATIVTATPVAETMMTSTSTTATTTNTMCHTQAYVILTEGVIGGTGNRNSRRGTEIGTGRVFGGDASVYRIVTQEATRIQNEFAMRDQGVSVTVRTVPVGKPLDYSSEYFLADWPPEVLQSTMMMINTDGDQKRTINSSSGDGGSGTTNNIQPQQYNDDPYYNGVVVDCPFELPDSKRRRIIPNSQMDDEMQFS